MNANYSYTCFGRTVLGIMGTSSIVTQNCEIEDIYLSIPADIRSYKIFYSFNTYVISSYYVPTPRLNVEFT